MSWIVTAIVAVTPFLVALSDGAKNFVAGNSIAAAVITAVVAVGAHLLPSPVAKK
jgi:flagellar biosynthesis component FlhA